MISKNVYKKFCNEDVSKIENYYAAINSNEMWDCHHRAEILPCGRFTMNLLKKYGLYYNRPANELIFLTRSLHMSIHHTGVTLSNETKEKMSISQKKLDWNSSKWNNRNRKISEKLRGHKVSLITKDKISAIHKGRNLGSLWNNGIEEKLSFDCLSIGYIKGRLYHKRSKKEAK